MDMIIHTYGGADILHNIFNAIAILMNNQGGGIARPLIIIAVSIASLWAITKAFFSGSVETLLSRYFFPVLLVVGVFLIPTKTVRIEDKITGKYYKVDNVPFLLAQFSQFASSIGYRMTEAVEAVMHMPNDVKYNATGMVFGAESALDMSKYKIRNGDFERNLREFSKQCVFYDLLLGRYSLQEMQKSTDLWGLFEERTSKVRMIDYVDPNSNDPSSSTQYLTCQQAVAKMSPLLKNEKNYYALQDIGKNLPSTFQALTKMSKEAGELINQQLLLDFFRDGFDAHGFAKRRAHQQQQSTYNTLGALASSSLISMRAVIEALVYSAFIFVLPMSVLPMGFRFLSTWIWLVVWIQLWPPFFAILSYIMQSAAQAQADSILHGLSSSEKGLSFFTSVGLFELNQDISALSGYLAVSIPFISYAILQGGVASFIHLAGAMMTPAHSAATTAAAEQTSGNYSFANVGLGQESLRNRTAFQNNMAPSLSSGHFSQNDGVSSTTYTPGDNIVKHHGSEFRNNLFSDESLSNSFSRSQNDAQSYVHSSQHSLNESLSDHSRKFGDLTNHLSQGDSASINWSGRDGYTAQESASYVKNAAENFANQYGINERDSMDMILGCKGDWSGGSGFSFNDTNTTDEAWNAAKNISESESFQTHLQNISDFSTSQSVGSMNDKGSRLVDGYTRSLDTVNSAQEQHQDALSNLHQVSENRAFTESLSVQEKKSLNQPFMNWASEQFSDEGGFGKAKHIIMDGTEAQKAGLVQDFLSGYTSSFQKDFEFPSQGYHDSHAEFENYKTRISENVTNDDTFQVAKSILKENYNDAKDQYTDYINDRRPPTNSEIHKSEKRIDGSLKQQKAEFNQKQSQYVGYQYAKKARNLVGSAPLEVLNKTLQKLGIGKVHHPESSSQAQPFWYSNKE